MGNLSSNQRLAAIDIGSNSFHMIIAACDQDKLGPSVRVGKKVQLAAGMENQQLAADAIGRGLVCLQQFVDQLKALSVTSLRVVATNALRIAENRQAFIEPAEQLLGCQIEVIEGPEEARLVYLGVSQDLPDETGRCLVIDIGGGSTELVVGEGALVRQAASVQIGCVSFLDYFFDGEINRSNFDRAYQAAKERLRAQQGLFANQWQACIGSSGTLLAIEQVLIQQGLSEQGISREGLAKLQDLLLGFHHLDEVSFQGLRESRRQVFASGVAITSALFDSLNINSMTLSNAALREGVLIDLLQTEKSSEN
jgi:exopolyphosphatase/guanosine-5'-triphosphate,3'-diphosphate pyrophosphatase